MIKKRCDMCSQKRDLFAYDGMKLCSGCKSDIMQCDQRKGTGKDVPMVLTNRAAASQRMMAAKKR